MDMAIWWVRRDLRLGDNQALAEALLRARRILPVFVLDPQLVASPWGGEKRLGFLFAALRSLDADLRSRGSYLVLRLGQLVVTSGMSLRFPRGLPVGRVERLGHDVSGLTQEIEIAPAARPSRLRHAYVVPGPTLPGQPGAGAGR